MGPVFGHHRSRTATRQTQEHRLSLWAGLDEEHQGEINRAKISKFLTSQGLPIKSEADVNVSLIPVAPTFSTYVQNMLVVHTCGGYVYRAYT